MRENLLRAGLHLFHHNGFTPTGIQEITDRAAVPKGSFYNHFTTKEEFGVEVVDAYARPRDLLLDESIPPLKRLEMDFDRKIESCKRSDFQGGCLLGNFGSEMSDHSEAIRERVASHFSKWSGAIAVCVSEAQAKGAIQNKTLPEHLARFVLNSWEGALIEMRVTRSETPLLIFKHIVFEQVLR